MKIGEHPIIKKLNPFVFRFLIPVLVIVLIIYAVIAPKTIHFDQDYYLVGTEIKVSGGETVIGPGSLLLWGRYPWVYGTVDGRGFRIDLKEKQVKIFETPEAYARFLHEEALDPALCVDPEVLRGDRDLQLRLKDLLYHRNVAR